MSNSRKYRRRQSQGGLLFVLPAIPEDAPPAFKNALVLRNEANLAGRCRCGAVGRLARAPTPGAIGRVVFEHEDACGALLDRDTLVGAPERPTSWQTIYRPLHSPSNSTSPHSSLTPAAVKRKWPRLAAKLDDALELLAPADPSTCPHQTNWPLLVCVQHPAAGGICHDCMPRHLRATHSEVAELTCDQCGELDDRIVPVLTSIVRNAIMAIGLGLCNRCYAGDQAQAGGVVA